MCHASSAAASHMPSTSCSCVSIAALASRSAWGSAGSGRPRSTECGRGAARPQPAGGSRLQLLAQRLQLLALAAPGSGVPLQYVLLGDESDDCDILLDPQLSLRMQRLEDTQTAQLKAFEGAQLLL